MTTTAVKTKRGFRLDRSGKSAEFTIGDYGSTREHDVTRFADGAHAWCVSAIDKLRAIGTIAADAGFAEATPKLPAILTAIGIVAKPAAAAAPQPSPAKAAPAPAPVTPTIAAPAPPGATTAQPLAASKTAAADDPATLAARVNGSRQTADNEQALADHGWSQIIANLNRRN
jgi:hypothetical protein